MKKDTRFEEECYKSSFIRTIDFMIHSSLTPANQKNILRHLTRSRMRYMGAKAKLIRSSKSRTMKFHYGGFLFKGTISMTIVKDNAELCILKFKGPTIIFPREETYVVDGEEEVYALKFSRDTGIYRDQSNKFKASFLASKPNQAKQKTVQIKDAQNSEYSSSSSSEIDEEDEEDDKNMIYDILKEEKEVDKLLIV